MTIRWTGVVDILDYFRFNPTPRNISSLESIKGLPTCRSHALFSDPQSLTINAVANSLPRTSSGVNSGIFSKDDGNVVLTISHQKTGKSRKRHTIRVDYRKLSADPFTTGHNLTYTMSTYLVVDHGDGELTNTEIKYVVDALTAYLTASTGANVTKLLGGES